MSRVPVSPNIVAFFATAGFVGRLPKAPGTFGTLVAVPIAVLFTMMGPNFYLIATSIAIGFSIWISELHERNVGTHDSKEIVIDEVVGFLVAFTWLPLTLTSLAATFLLFRFFDIVKPYPISVLDRRVRGGLGVVVDDLAAGLATSLILQFVASKTTWLHGVF